MNNLMQLVSAVRSGGNPYHIMQQMAMSNPQAAQAMRMMQGKTPAELQQMATNMCRERGTTPEAVLHQLGLR